MKPLWSSWPSLRRRIVSAEHLFLFLDYDGTLAPIADHPSKARLPARARRFLQQLARQPGSCVALVSGRRLSDLKAMVQLPGLLYIGNHGLELQGPKLRYAHPGAQARRPLLKRMAQLLKKTLQPIPEAWVEDKGLTLSVHYRSVPPGRAPLVRNILHEVVKPYLEKSQVRIAAGKRVFEVRPAVRWTKGTVVHWLLARHLAAGKKRTLPIYIGDDQTDEDAFKALGSEGLSIRVGRSEPSYAQYALSSPREVEKFLRRLLEMWKQRP